jgi:hypothetical protein
VRSRGGSLLLGVALVTSSIAASRDGLTQPSAETATARRIVSVDIRGGSPESGRLLEATIRDLLARLQLTTVKRWTSAAAVLANAEIDLTDASGGAHVLVRSSSGATILDDTIPRDPNPAIERERIAHAVRGAAEAELLAEEDRVAARTKSPQDGGRPAPAGPASPASPAAEAKAAPAPEAKPAEAGSAPPEAKTPPPPPSEVETRATPVAAPDRDSPAMFARPEGGIALDVSTVAGAGLVAADTSPVARVGGSIALASRQGWRPSIAIGALYALPFDTGSDTLTSRTTMVSLRAVPAIELFRANRFALHTGVGAGIDILAVRPSSEVLPAASLNGSSSRVDPVLSAAVTAQLALASDVVLLFTATSDFDLASRHYVFDDRGQRSDVLAPWNVRPTLLAGLSFSAFGEAPFATRGGR